MFGQLGYLIAESFRGWKQQRTVILPSLITIFLCSLLLASSLVALCGVVRLLEAEKSLYSVEAFLPGEIPADSAAVIRHDLERMKHIDSVEYVSADSALADFRRHFDGEMLELVEGNPIPPFFRIRLDEESSNPIDLIDVRNAVMRIGIFEEVQAPVEWVEKISAWKFRMVFWPVCLSVLLLVTLSLIICNSVRLSLLSRKLLVENMKYAGGSYGFIEFPFVLEGLMQGLVGSGVASLLLLVLMNSVTEALPMVGAYMEGAGTLLVLVVLLVSALSAYFSFRTVRSFLHATRNEQVG
ncbi:permease-like cell division protein FtsX [uncultured Fibrobacter sp.]|uniref:cell division protein FtsX n=1 Tax=uncultured Fibrobacter sp. TaxID=261512 RepID=UPI0025F7A31F|nr:permease-like cell division protein FtsX [uncultured Fibrobacter sp.]